MTTLTAGMRDELAGLTAKMTAIQDAAVKEGRGLTAEDTTQLKSLMDEARPIADSVKMLTEIADMKTLSEFGALSSPATPFSVGSGNIVGAKSFGESYVASKGYTEGVKKWQGPDGSIAGSASVRIEPEFVPSTLKGMVYAARAAIQGKTLITQNPTLPATTTPVSALTMPDRQPFTVDRIGDPTRVLKGLVRRIPTASNAVEWVEITAKGTNNAAVVPEAQSVAGATAKPESVFWSYALKSKTIDTIAHWIPITRQTLADIPQLAGMIDEFLVDGLEEKLEAAILTEILANIGFALSSPGSDLDAIANAIATVRTQGKRNPTTVVMNPDDWYSAGFALLKDTTGRYMLVDPTTSIDNGINLWGRRLVITDQIPANACVVGDFQQAILWDREQASIAVSDSHADFFIKNMLVVLAELRASVSVLDPKAFATVSGI